jgi:hypothetical protein
MKEIIMPLESGKIPEYLKRFVENDQSYCPEKFSDHLKIDELQLHGNIPKINQFSKFCFLFILDI